MTVQQTFVIVGAGLAGAKAAETLRDEGFTGRLVMFGEEPDRPYERPPLSKEYLRGEAKEGSPWVHDEGFYEAHDIELRTSTRVQSVDVDAREVVFDGTERLRYDALLLATGAAPRQLPLAGSDLEGVHYLRSRGDSDALRTAIGAASRVVVVGAGWIGSEVAASARQMGVEVAVVAPEAVPLERVLGPEIGGVYRDLHADHGVELHLSTAIQAIVGDGYAAGVRTEEGHLIQGDVVVVGVGAVPRDELAHVAGLEVDNGIVVNEMLETSAPGIFAAGDVANAWNPLLGKRLRVEHWANALNQGPAAARNMLGRRTPYAKLPYFYSDQYDLGMEYHGHADTWDQVVVRGDLAAREFLAFWVKDGRVTAGMNANIWDAADDIKGLVRSGEPVDVRRLADPAVPLGEVAVAR